MGMMVYSLLMDDAGCVSSTVVLFLATASCLFRVEQ